MANCAGDDPHARALPCRDNGHVGDVATKSLHVVGRIRIGPVKSIIGSPSATISGHAATASTLAMFYLKLGQGVFRGAPSDREQSADFGFHCPLQAFLLVLIAQCKSSE